MGELRLYQHNGIDNIARKIAQGKRKLIFQLATGGGKTVCFAGLTQRYLERQKRKVVIMVHREELLKQARRTLFEWQDIVAAPVTAGSSYFPNTMVYVAMVETAFNRLKKNPTYFGDTGMLIIDEAHIGNFKKVHQYFPESLVIGFTATPISSSRKDPLKNYFEDIVCGIDIPQLIAERSLVPNVTTNIAGIKRSGLQVAKNGEFDERQMGQVFSGTRHIQNCVAAYQQLTPGKKTLVFNCDIDHSKRVNAAFEAFGYPTRHLDGETPDHERAGTLHWFKHTPGAILNNVGVLTTGFDEPSVENIVVNRSTTSLPLWLQMTGRGARPFTGKEVFTILDLGENGSTLGDWCEPRDWNDIFHNPPKPGEPGECPSKPCGGCRILIPAGTITCPHCGHENKRKVVYDAAKASFKQYAGRRLPDIYIEEMIKEAVEKEKKPYSVLHRIKQQLSYHARYKWRMRTLDDATAEQLIRAFQEKAIEWCDIRKEKFEAWREEDEDRFKRTKAWHHKRASQWMHEELKRLFKWEPTAASVNQ